MLRYRADLKTLVFVAAFFGLVAIQLIYRPAELWVAIPLVVLTCWFSFFCATITHNTVHAPIFEQRWLNRLFQIVLTLAYGHPVSSYVPGHNLSHHQYTQTTRDVMRTTKMRFRWNLLNVVLFMFRMAPDIMRADGKYGAVMRKRKPVWFKQMLLEALVLNGLYALLIYADWRAFLLYVFLPHRYAGWGIITMNFLQHDGCDQDTKYNHSRNFVGGIVNWLTFNNGYHTIHHHEASLHWSLLPAAHAEEIAPHIHPALDQHNLLAYLWRAFGWPGKRVNYDGRAVVLPPKAPDDDWIPAPNETPPEVSLGAAA